MQDIQPKIVQVGNMLQIVPVDTVEQVNEKMEDVIPIIDTSLPPPTMIVAPVPSPQVTVLLQQPEKISAEEMMKQKIAERVAEREKRRIEREKKREEKERRKEERRLKKLKQKTDEMMQVIFPLNIF